MRLIDRSTVACGLVVLTLGSAPVRAQNLVMMGLRHSNSIAGNCNAQLSGAIVTASGTCQFQTGDENVSWVGNGTVNASTLRMHLSSRVFGASRFIGGSYAHHGDGRVDDFVTVAPKAGLAAPAASSVLFTTFLTGGVSGNVTRGAYTASGWLLLDVGQFGTSYSTGITGGQSATVGSPTLSVPFAAFTSGPLRMMLRTRIVASASVFAQGSLEFFDVMADFSHTAGISYAQVLDASGADVSAFYDIRTTTVDLHAPTAVPEPTTVALVGGGLLALGGTVRRRRS